MTRNVEIGKTLSEFCLISGDWGALGIPNLAEMSVEMLLNAARCQGYSFFGLWVIKGKQAWDKITPSLHKHTQIRVKSSCLFALVIRIQPNYYFVESVQKELERLKTYFFWLSLPTLLEFYLRIQTFVIFFNYRFQKKQISTPKIWCVPTSDEKSNSTSWV